MHGSLAVSEDASVLQSDKGKKRTRDQAGEDESKDDVKRVTKKLKRPRRVRELHLQEEASENDGDANTRQEGSSAAGTESSGIQLGSDTQCCGLPSLGASPTNGLCSLVLDVARVGDFYQHIKEHVDKNRYHSEYKVDVRGEESVKCGICQGYTQRRSILRHITQVHFKLNGKLCVCGKWLSRSDSNHLGRHNCPGPK